MNTYFLLVILMALSAAFAYLNHRFIRMPFVIGLFFLSTILSLIVVSSRWWSIDSYVEIKYFIEQVDISKFILDIMLGFLLFAGSLHTHWAGIKNQLRAISLFAVGGVMLSTILIASMLFWVSSSLGVSLDYLHCLIFGALISPTDPIAVLGIFSKANVPKKIEATIIGESLFNDGVGVVVFIALLETLKLGTDQIDTSHFAALFVQEAVGGAFFGLTLGYALHRLLKSIDNYETEVLLTIAFVMGGYSLCQYFHISGALAMVIMGLLVGNYRQNTAMSDKTLEYVYKFWELVDVILNAILFISIAFLLVVIDFNIEYITIGLLAIAIVLLARVLTVYVPSRLLPGFVNLTRNEAKLIVWGGLRGGLSIALVLSLPRGGGKPVLMFATYTCVVFSILIQGLSIEKVARRLVGREPAAPHPVRDDAGH